MYVYDVLYDDDDEGEEGDVCTLSCSLTSSFFSPLFSEEEDVHAQTCLLPKGCSVGEKERDCLSGSFCFCIYVQSITTTTTSSENGVISYLSFCCCFAVVD